MQIYGPSHVHGSQPLSGPHNTRSPQQTPRASAADGGDQLDISEAGQLAARLDEIPDIREDLVARVRDQIDRGDYETEQRLDIALERLLDEVG